MGKRDYGLALIAENRFDLSAASAVFQVAKTGTLFPDLSIRSFLCFRGETADAPGRVKRLGLPGWPRESLLEIAGTPDDDLSGARLLELETVFRRHRCRAVLLFGGGNLALTAALAARKEGILTARANAKPDESGRLLAVDRLADILFCETRRERNALSEAGMTGSIRVTGTWPDPPQSEKIPADHARTFRTGARLPEASERAARKILEALGRMAWT